jgi:hypothetical protein
MTEEDNAAIINNKLNNQDDIDPTIIEANARLLKAMISKVDKNTLRSTPSTNTIDVNRRNMLDIVHCANSESAYPSELDDRVAVVERTAFNTNRAKNKSSVLTTNQVETLRSHCLQKWTKSLFDRVQQARKGIVSTTRYMLTPYTHTMVARRHIKMGEIVSFIPMDFVDFDVEGKASTSCVYNVSTRSLATLTDAQWFTDNRYGFLHLRTISSLLFMTRNTLRSPRLPGHCGALITDEMSTNWLEFINQMPSLHVAITDASKYEDLYLLFGVRYCKDVMSTVNCTVLSSYDNGFTPVIPVVAACDIECGKELTAVRGLRYWTLRIPIVPGTINTSPLMSPTASAMIDCMQNTMLVDRLKVKMDEIIAKNTSNRCLLNMYDNITRVTASKTQQLQSSSSSQTKAVEPSPPLASSTEAVEPSPPLASSTEAIEPSPPLASSTEAVEPSPPLASSTEAIEPSPPLQSDVKATSSTTAITTSVSNTRNNSNDGKKYQRKKRGGDSKDNPNEKVWRIKITAAPDVLPSLKSDSISLNSFFKEETHSATVIQKTPSSNTESCLNTTAHALHPDYPKWFIHKWDDAWEAEPLSEEAEKILTQHAMELKQSTTTTIITTKTKQNTRKITKKTSTTNSQVK